MIMIYSIVSHYSHSSEQPRNHTLGLRLPPRLLHNLLLNRIHIGLEIHLIQFDNLCLLDELPHHIHDEHDRQLDVEADKADAVECGTEAAPSLHENEEAVEDDADPRAVGVRPVLEW